MIQKQSAGPNVASRNSQEQGGVPKLGILGITDEAKQQA